MKKVYPDLMKQTDKFRKTPEQAYLRLPDLNNNEDSQRRLEFLRKFFAFQFTSGIIQDVQVKWIQCTQTVKELQEQLEDGIPEDKKHTYRWYNGKIAYDHKKLRQYFSDQSMIEKVQRYLPNSTKNSYSLDVYESELKQAQGSLQPKTMILRNNVIDLKQEKNNRLLSDVEFNALVEVIKPYSLAAINKIQSSIPDDVKAYINYICFTNNAQLKDIDKERYDILKDMLSGNNLNEIPDFCDILNIKKSQAPASELELEIDLDTFK